MSRSVSAPSSVTKTSPCWNGLIVPGSTFRYGSNFCSWTRSPRALRSRPSEAATMPFPRAETTPPVTKTYFGDRALTGFQGSSRSGLRRFREAEMPLERAVCEIAGELGLRIDVRRARAQQCKRPAREALDGSADLGVGRGSQAEQHRHVAQPSVRHDLECERRVHRVDAIRHEPRRPEIAQEPRREFSGHAGRESKSDRVLGAHGLAGGLDEVLEL